MDARNQGKKEQKVGLYNNEPLLEIDGSDEPSIKVKNLLNSSAIPEVSLDSIVIKAPVDHTTQEQTARILREFNKNVKKGESCFTTSVVRGEQIPPGRFWLGIRNNTPELHGPSGQPIARTLMPQPGQFTEILNQNINQSDHFYGDRGTYVLNIPAGHYAKANSGNKQLIYGEGCHVIHDPNFSFTYDRTSVVDQNTISIEHGTIHIFRVPAGKVAKIWIGAEAFILTGRKEPYVFNTPLLQIVENSDNTYFFDQNVPYITHGTMHILRVPVGKFAKIWLGQEARILDARSEPYNFNDPQFKLEPKNADNLLFDQSDLYIHHGNKTYMRIPAGKYAKIWIGGEARILFSQDKLYEFDTPLFRLEMKQDGTWLFNQTDAYIHHGTRHIIRVPAGKIAKVWVGPEARLLESNKEPHEFTDPFFRLEENTDPKDKSIFFNATARLIEHGNIKRVIPHYGTGEVAITFDNGKLKILRANEDGTPHKIISPTHEVSGFLSTSMVTKVFPEKDSKQQGAKENTDAKAKESNYLCFNTRDSLRVGVELLVAYKITDPEKALSILRNNEGIVNHIESIAKADMGRAIQQCSSQEFLNFSQTKPEPVAKPDSLIAPTTPEKKKLNYQDIVSLNLAKDLQEYGIELVRFNIEKAEILDQKIAEQMAQASITSAKTYAEVSNLEQNSRINRVKAEQDAEKKSVEQKQINDAKALTAKAELDAAKLKAQAQIEQAEGEKKAAMLKAEGEAQSMLLKADAEAKGIAMRAKAEKEALEVKGKAFQDFPSLVQVEIAKAQVDMLKGTTLSLTSPEFAQILASNPYTLFRIPPMLSNQQNQLVKQEPEKKFSHT